MSADRCMLPSPPQQLVFAKHWTPRLQTFVTEYMRRSPIIFAFKTEASFYANVKQVAEVYFEQ